MTKEHARQAQEKERINKGTHYSHFEFMASYFDSILLFNMNLALSMFLEGMLDLAKAAGVKVKN